MYVSSYDPIIDTLLARIDDKSDEAPARQLEKRVGDFLKKALDESYREILDATTDWLLNDMQEAIRAAARQLAEQYVQSALAGDEDTFVDMFDHRHGWKSCGYWAEGRLPLGVRLRRQLLEKHRDLFASKAIEDLEGELAALKRLRNLGGWRRMVEGDL